MAPGVFEVAAPFGAGIVIAPLLIHPQSEEVYHEVAHFDARPRFSDPASFAHQKETKQNLAHMPRTEMAALLVMPIHRHSGGLDISRFREFR